MQGVTGGWVQELYGASASLAAILHLTCYIPIARPFCLLLKCEGGALGHPRGPPVSHRVGATESTHCFYVGAEDPPFSHRVTCLALCCYFLKIFREALGHR